MYSVEQSKKGYWEIYNVSGVLMQSADTYKEAMQDCEKLEHELKTKEDRFTVLFDEVLENAQKVMKKLNAANY